MGLTFDDLDDDFGFDPQSRRNFIYNNIPRSVWEEYSGQAILASLRSAGLGIGTDDFYDIRSNILDDIENADRVRGIPSYVQVPIDFMTEGSFWNNDADYIYTLQVTQRDPLTGEPITRYTTLRSNDQLSQDDILELMSDDEGNVYDPSDNQILEMKLYNALYRPGLFG